MRRFIPVWVALSVMFPLHAQAKHPFAFEDMMALKRLGEPVPSPDGKWVLFSAVDVDLAANARVNHVWIVPSAGGEARPIIKDQDADRPRWAPDGKRFAFVSSKEGGSQIWIADFDGASGAVSGVHKLTSVATEAQGELWSPDGKNILFVSNVYADCTDEACNQQKLEQSKQSKVKAMLFTHLLYRHWNNYKEGRRSHLLVVPAEGGRSRDLTPGDYDAPVFSLGGQDNYAFSPDGQEVCYTSNHDEVEATSTNNDLFVVSVNGGPSKKIVDNPASDSTPLYSPDGRYIAYRAQARPGYESDRFRLMLYERTTGKKRGLTDNFDRWVGAFAWAPDSKYIYFTAENAGEAPIYEVAVDGRMDLPREVVGGYDDDLTVTDGGHVVMFTRMSIASPSAIYRADTAMPRPGCKDDRFGLKRSPAGYVSPPCALSDALPLTHVNDAVLSQVAMSALEPFWFTGSENAKVEGFLIKPPTFNPQDKYPMKFLIHGGPQGAWGDDWSYRWNAELLAANGYVVIMINPRGSTGYGQRFIDDVNADWGGHAFQDLMLGLDYAEKTYPFIDKQRECALGASFGGYMINWILGHSHRFKCLVSHDGLFNTTSAWGTTEELWFNEWEFKGTPYSNHALYDNWSPHLSAMNFKTPTLVIHGQQDYRLDVSEGFQLFTTLQRLGVPSKMLYFPDEGHWVLKPQNSQLWYRTVNDWVDQWVKKSPTVAERRRLVN